MTPYETVARDYTLPFDGYGYQKQVINGLAPLPRTGHYLAVGVGKTFTSTCCTLYKFAIGEADQAIVLMPPILMATWYRWLTSIKGLRVLVYRGSPKERAAMDFSKYDFVLMSYDIFKRDSRRIFSAFDHSRTVLVCDEATAIKNVESKNYKAVQDFATDGHLMLLTGTPLAKIMDGYAYIALVAPTIYRGLQHYENIHIEEWDFFGAPVEYRHLDVLERNMRVNAVRILKEDVLTDLPQVTYTPLHYDLEEDHLNLYMKLAEEQLLEFNDGSRLDATEATKLWHALQQIVMNYDYFSDDPENVSMGFRIIDQTMSELEADYGHQHGKLIVFTNYKQTSQHVTAFTQKYGAVAVYGEIPAGEQQTNIDRFVDDPTCRILVAQVQSAGYGLNLQDCCADVLFLEAPLSPIHFEQAVGRVYRNGQKRKVHVRVAIAQGTIQVHLSNILMSKDTLVNQVLRNYQDIRQALYGK
jgi:SNF2 family DNA or RNA helicase